MKTCHNDMPKKEFLVEVVEELLRHPNDKIMNLTTKAAAEKDLISGRIAIAQ